MVNNIISRRYAKALILLARQNGIVDEIHSQFAEFVAYYKNDHGFKEFIELPFVEKKARKDVVALLFNQLFFKDELRNFINLLIDNKRINLLPDIFIEFSKIKDELYGIIRMTLVSSQKIKDEYLNELKAMVAKNLNKQIVFEEKISPDIIGGFLIGLNGKLYDGSIKSQLNNYDEEKEQPLLSGYKKDKLGRRLTITDSLRGNGL